MAEKIEDLNLPNTVVLRLIKDSIPPNIIISKDARTAIGKASSVFVLYVTSAATTVAKKAGRKTVSPIDILEAMENLEFPNFVEPLKRTLEQFRQSQKEKKDLKRKQKDDNEEAVEDEEEAEMVEK